MPCKFEQHGIVFVIEQEVAFVVAPITIDRREI